MSQERKKLTPVSGVVTFIIMIVLMIFVAGPVQYYLGMTGLAITEILILLTAVVPALILRQDLREVFPIKLPKIREFFGTICIWIACLLFVFLGTGVVMYFFPQQMTATSQGMNELFVSIPFFLSFIIVAILPAICEEALHRGFILHTMKGIKKDWVRVLVMGIIFGVFHLSPVRFLTTGILGLGLTYVMVRSGNLLLPILYHFFNNAFSLIMTNIAMGMTSGVQAAETAAVTQNDLIAVVGVYLFMASIAPFLLLGGCILMHDKEWRASRTGKWLVIRIVICVVLFLAMLAAGMLMVLSAAAQYI